MAAAAALMCWLASSTADNLALCKRTRRASGWLKKSINEE
jgi:hypothetical protein